MNLYRALCTGSRFRRLAKRGSLDLVNGGIRTLPFEVSNISGSPDRRSAAGNAERTKTSHRQLVFAGGFRRQL